MRKFLYLLVFFIINSNCTHFSKSVQPSEDFFIFWEHKLLLALTFFIVRE